ncbi:hypothetical protein [Paludibacterium purpuratum]|uniref:Uncharacterized protein n=1 Tax=Paludibacterium purpuratum TaxID=1144873 RepID=A0A4R7BF19_9NEIS|nr:hypothetical protein [Paludibacterium purpuratum]TDR82862.1 hypothetical protein DFP86_101252 [Paludibacterium purpuratum]
MVVIDSKTVPVFSQNPDSRQQQLFSLISMLCTPRRSRPNSDECRLIVDSRLPWAFEPIDGNTSWLYLPQAAQARKLAGCLVLTAD